MDERHVLKERSRILALFGIVASFACAQVNSDPGSAGTGGNGNSGVTGTGGVFGTGSGGLSGTGGAGGLIGGGGGERACGLETFPLVRKPASLMLVLDRSASMQKNSADETPTGPTDPTKWAQVVPAMTSVVTQTGTGLDISWGLKTFPEDGPECSNAPSTVTSKIDVPIAPMNATAMNAAINTTLPNGNGTPTGAAIRVAVAYFQTLPNDSQKFILLASDGDPSCSGSSGTLSKNTAGAATDATAAVVAAAAAGIPTFVVGVGSVASSLMTLNMLATAGGRAVPDPNPLAVKFYQAASQAQLSSALKAITAQVTTCTFPLTKPPPVPEKIAVKVSGVKAPQDLTNGNGWNYVDSTHMAVQVFGSWCDMIKTSAADMVDIIFGCPNIDIP